MKRSKGKKIVRSTVKKSSLAGKSMTKGKKRAPEDKHWLGINTVEELGEVIIFQGKIRDWREVPETGEDPDE